ncbi:hypothetical protein HHI36_019987 [Cryptolaemus montrouzieri]|uniref:VPS37 C-terminal domain-containing protein n=1 Tax=Cryptolaemus montrouzieri TaxID=559131 RepID=A0ABD2N8X5_9CUCU
MLNEVCNIQVTFGTMNFCPSEFSMSYMDYLSNNTNNYLSLLKTTIKLYMGINEKLTEEINIITRELEESKKNVVKDFNFSDEEIYALEKKVSVYESELEKFEKKHPWLRNPQLDLIHISKECQILADQQEEKEALEKELVTYQGLKPDIQEASRQLFATKKLYEELKSKLRSGV